MAKVGDFTREEIREAMAGVRGRAARIMARDLAVRLNLSEGYIYRLSADGRRGRRKMRKDAGDAKIIVSGEVALFMESLTREADLSAETVIFATARHFGLAEDFLSPTTYNAWLRQRRMSRGDLKKDLRPYRSFEAAKANALHHYDTTVAEAFYANDDGSIGHEPRAQRYKNKPGNRKERLVLYSLIDDYSRVIYARFYFSENALNLLDFVRLAWSQKDDRRFPFFGFPEAFYADNGSPRKSKKFVRAAESLGVRLLDSDPAHATPFGSRKHGKVERTFGEGLLGEFMKLTLIYRFADIDELNATLWEWLIHVNNRTHSVTHEKRFARWVRTVGTPRCMPSEELWKTLHWDRTTRTVTRNLQISLNGHVYQLPYRRPFINWVDAKIEVYSHPGEVESIVVVHDHYEEEIPRLAPVIDLAEQYRTVPTTDQEKRIAEGKEKDFNTVNWPEIYKTDVPYLPKKGEKFDDKKIAAKVVETESGEWRPKFTPTLMLNPIAVLRALEKAGLAEIGEDGKYTQASLDLRDTLMAGRDTVSDEDVELFVRDCRDRQRLSA